MTKISRQFLISGQFQDNFKISGISGISGQLGALQLYSRLFSQQLRYMDDFGLLALTYLGCFVAT